MTGGSTRLQGRTRRLLRVMAVAVIGATVVGCGSNSGSSAGSSGDGTITLEFAQWWAPELPTGSFDKLMSEFTAQNPTIKVKLLSGPYASTKQQLVSGAASRTLPDVVGLDGAWVSDFAKQGAIADLSELMAAAKYDSSQLASQIQVKGKTYMIPVVNFVYPCSSTTICSRRRGSRRLRARARSSWRRPRRSAHLAATSKAGPCHSTPLFPTASRMT